MISPVRPRAKASGLTRMSVLSIGSFRSGRGAAARQLVVRGASVATVGWSVVSRRRRRRAEGGGLAPVSASQYGHSFHVGSIGFPQEKQESLSLRMQLG